MNEHDDILCDVCAILCDIYVQVRVRVPVQVRGCSKHIVATLHELATHIDDNNEVLFWLRNLDLLPRKPKPTTVNPSRKRPSSVLLNQSGSSS